MQYIFRASYVEDSYMLIVITNFVGPDGLRRGFNVTGIPNEKAARDFMAHMGWKDVPLKLVAKEMGRQGINP